MAITWTGAGVFGSIGKAVKEGNADSVNATSMLSAAVSFIQSYIEYNFRYLGEITHQTFNDVYWEGLVEKMEDDSQSINGNTVTAGAVSFTGDGTGTIQNAAVTPVANQVSPTQMLLDDDVFLIVCTAASVGNDTWVVHSMRRGQISKTARTDQLYGEELTSDDTAGISFTINAPADTVEADPSSVFTSFDIDGGEKGVNSDSNGQVYVGVSWDSGGYHMTGYPSAGDRTSDTNAVFSVTYDATGTHAITEENDSGLSGTVVIQTLATNNAITLTLNIPYAVGDKFEVAACTSDDGGVFQTFFRDNFSKTLPYDTSGSETIDDSLAQ
jgi:hypothetical protein